MQAYTIEQAANVIGVDKRTLRRYDERGIFVALRHVSGRMYYTYEMLQDYIYGSYNPEDTEKYAELPKAPISIQINSKILPVVEGFEESDKTTYYKIPRSDEYTSEYNILRLERPERTTSTIVTYTVGKFENEGNVDSFISAFSWKSLEF